MTPESYDLYNAHSPGGINISLAPTPKPSRSMGFLDWMRYFRQRRFDACVLIKGSFPIGSLALDLAARLSFGAYTTLEQLMADSIPRSSRRHFGFIPGFGFWWRRKRFLGMLRSLGPRTIMCVSDAVRRKLIEEYRFPASKLVIVHNGVDTARFQPTPSFRQATRLAWGIPSDALVFGAIGRFAAQKGYDVALAGFQRVLDRFPERDLWLVLVGEGELEESLKASAAKIVPNGRVKFQGFSSRPWEALNAIDVFVMPSLNEGLPLALVEAMACGCCPVASAAGGIPEALPRPDLGWLVPLGDSAAFGDAMIEAASRTRQELAGMAAVARGHVTQHFDANTQFNLMVDIIESRGAVHPPKLGELAAESLQS
jgi:glycosyltransferase involved in cell wall biosynthesis